jgi:hypothetical protein
MTDFTSTPFTRQFRKDCEALAERQAKRDNLTQDYPAEFLALWEGCSHVDCLPQCLLHSMDSGYCARLEAAYAEYNGRVK